MECWSATAACRQLWVAPCAGGCACNSTDSYAHTFSKKWRDVCDGSAHTNARAKCPPFLAIAKDGKLGRARGEQRNNVEHPRTGIPSPRAANPGERDRLSKDHTWYIFSRGIIPSSLYPAATWPSAPCFQLPRLCHLTHHPLGEARPPPPLLYSFWQWREWEGVGRGRRASGRRRSCTPRRRRRRCASDGAPAGLRRSPPTMRGTAVGEGSALCDAIPQAGTDRRDSVTGDEDRDSEIRRSPVLQGVCTPYGCLPRVVKNATALDS